MTSTARNFSLSLLLGTALCAAVFGGAGVGQSGQPGENAGKPGSSTPADDLRRAGEAFNQGDYALSLASARRASAGAPVLGNVAAARALAAISAWPAAEAAALDAKESAETPNGDLAMLLALIYREQGKNDAAIDELQSAAVAFPSDGTVANELALRLLDAGRPQDAQAVLERLSKAAPGAADVGVLGLTLAALPNHDATAITHLRLALGAVSDGTAQANQTTTLVPTGDLHFRLGELLSSPTSPNPSAQEMALEHFERAYQLSPNSSDLAYRLSQMYRQLGRTAEATSTLAEFQRIRAEADANDAEQRRTGVRLNEAQDMANSNQLAAALEIVDEVLMAHPRSYSGHALRAKILFSQQKVEAALASIRKASALAPGIVEFQYLEGLFARTAGRHQDAREALERALDLDPNLAEAHAILGGILLQQGDPTGSLQHLDRAIALGADGEQIERARSIALERIGR